MRIMHWHIFHTRKRTPFYVALYTGAMAFGSRCILNFNYHGRLFHINGVVAMPENEMSMCRERTLTAFNRNHQFLLKIMAVTYRDYKKFLPLWKIISKLPFKKLSNKDLAGWLKKYIKSINLFWSVGLVPLYVEDKFTEEVNKFVSDRLPPVQAAQALQVLFTPLKEGIVGMEYRKLLKVALLPRYRQVVALKRHRQDFAWLANQLYTHTFHPLNYFRNRLQKLARQNPAKMLADYRSKRRKHFEDYDSWLRQLKPDRRMSLIIKSLNEAIYYRSWRGEKPYQSEWIIAPLIEEIAFRFKLIAPELLFCLPREIIDSLENGAAIPLVKIRSRQKGFVYLPYQPERILIGSDVGKWKRRVGAGLSGSMTELKGQIAFAGCVVGQARIVLHHSEINKVKHGDVLVCGSTTPAYVPALNKVKAIVAEEGGVLSHASIISRELKIPCIIGAKIATKVFKDGDMVEVDAEKGVVRKL